MALASARDPLDPLHLVAVAGARDQLDPLHLVAVTSSPAGKKKARTMPGLSAYSTTPSRKMEKASPA